MDSLLLVISLLATTYFSAIESSLTKLSAARIDETYGDRPKQHTKLMKYVGPNRARYINTFQLLYTLGLAASSLFVFRFSNSVFAQEANWLQDLTAIGVIALISFVIFGVGAQTLGKQNAEIYVLSSAGLISLLSKILNPFVRLFIALGNAVTPGKGYSEGPFASTAEIREMMDQISDEVIEASEKEMINSVFELGATVAREVMVPRTEMVWIERNKSLRQAMSLSLRSGYSRIPVIGEDIDDVVGVVYIKDVAKRIFEHSEAQQTERVDTLMRKVTFSPDSKLADELLKDMQRERVHLVVLIDEYGGTAGLVTIEDVLEEIVGEIADEHDTAEEEIINLDENTYRISSRLHIEDLAKLIHVDLDSDDEGVDTVGGLLAARLGRVAIPGSTINLDGWTLTAETVAGRRNRVGSLLVEKNDVLDEENE
jgi:CBS domain containing-hemolysin-like protein